MLSAPLTRRFGLLLSLPKNGLLMLVRGYRLFFKAWLGNACRFEPSCSAYAITAVERFGAVRGSFLTGQRLLRCQPWCAGGHDPVPEANPEANPSANPDAKAGTGLFTRLGLPRAEATTPIPSIHDRKPT
jgi:uncharacterized protein